MGNSNEDSKSKANDALGLYRHKFIEEATEMVHTLESSLLSLEDDASNPETVNEVFRALHTLKGGSGMFGYTSIESLTQELECIYDCIRANKFAFSKEIGSLTFLAVDLVKDLLADPEVKDERLKERLDEIKKEIATISSNDIQIEHLLPNQNQKQSYSTYYIYFKPSSDIFDDGSNPMYLLDELALIGEVYIKPNLAAVPTFDDIVASRCYISWHILLYTSKSTEDITSVFMFIGDQCILKLHKISPKNLLKNKLFVYGFDKLAVDELDIPYYLLKDLNIQADHNANKRSNSSQMHDFELATVRVSSTKLDDLMNLISELITNNAELMVCAEQQQNPKLSSVAEKGAKIVRKLRENAFSIRLIPLKSLDVRFQRLVRDLSLELEKEVVLLTVGAETGLDKTILNNIADPIMHLLRNAVDHGIEHPAERLKKGKSEHGIVKLEAQHSGNNIFIRVKDDGRGIDLRKIKAKGIELGMIHANQEINDKELIRLIFQPGFTTSEIVTDISGRGVGMDVVSRMISDIKGTVEVESKIGEGTEFTIKLPLTLSIIDALLVRIGEGCYLIPLSEVLFCSEVEHKVLIRQHNNRLVLDDEMLPFVYLRREFKIKDNCPDIERIVVVKYGEQKVAIIVDSIIGDHQAVLKPLGEVFKNQEFISEASILGDGNVALLIDTNKLVKVYTE